MFVTEGVDSNTLRGTLSGGVDKMFVISSNKYLFGHADSGGLEVTRIVDGSKLYPTSIEMSASGEPIIHYEDVMSVDKTIKFRRVISNT